MASTDDDSHASPSDQENAPNYVSRILKGSGSVLSGSLVGKGIAFLLNLVLTRGLGPALYGLYSLALTIIRLLQGTASLGLQNGIVRFATPPYERGEPKKVKGVFIAGGVIGLGMGLTTGIVLYGLSPWLAHEVFQSPDLTGVLKIFAVSLPFHVCTFLASRMARALGKIQVDVLLSSILQPGIFLVLVSGLFLAQGHFTVALYAFLASTILSALGGVYAVYRLFPPLFSTLSSKYDVRALLRFSIPIVGINLTSAGLTYADRLMLGAFSTSEAVGIYTAAASMALQLRFVLSAINTPFSPLIADLYQNDKLSSLSTLYADTVRWIVLLTLPGVLIFFTFAPQIMSIYGAGFRDGALLLRILAVSYLFVTGVGSVGHMLQMSDHQDFVLTVNVLMAVLNVVLNWVLIQDYGATGAAIATGTTQALGNLVQLGALYYLISIHPLRKALWKPVVAAAVACLPAWGLYTLLSDPTRWLVGVPAIFLVYGGVTFGLGLHERDQEILTGLWNELWSSTAQ